MDVNKARDFVERVVWTAVQAFAASAIVLLSADEFEWADVFKVAGVAALIAALKVLAAQNLGDNNDGAAIPGGIREGS